MTPAQARDPRRVVIGALLGAVVLGVLVWDHARGADDAALGLVAVLVPTALFEVYAMAGGAGFRPFWRLGLAACGCLLVGRISGRSSPAALGLFVLAVAASAAALRRGPDRETVLDLALTALGVAYVAWLGAIFVDLRRLDAVGESAFLGTILVTKLGDAGAYFAGRSLGRRRLAPRVSPAKTWEGALGGAVVSAATGAAVASLSPLGAAVGGWCGGMAFGIVVGIAGQLGDLSESLLKRGLAAKDSARWFAGMGGVLDLIDSLLYAGPLAYFLLRALAAAQGAASAPSAG